MDMSSVMVNNQKVNEDLNILQSSGNQKTISKDVMRRKI